MDVISMDVIGENQCDDSEVNHPTLFGDDGSKNDEALSPGISTPPGGMLEALTPDNIIGCDAVEEDIIQPQELNSVNRRQFSAGSLHLDEIGQMGKNITLEDAKLGLLKAIVYLESHPAIASEHIESLWNVLKHIEECAGNIDNQDTDVEGLDFGRDGLLAGISATYSQRTGVGPQSDDRQVLDSVKAAVESVVKQELVEAEDTDAYYSDAERSTSAPHGSEPDADDADDMEQVDEKSPQERVRRNICLVCKKVCSTAMQLQRHLLTHGGKDIYACDVCGNLYKLESNLRRHKKTHEKQPKEEETAPKYKPRNRKAPKKAAKVPKTFACTDCDEVFTKKSLLKKHPCLQPKEQSCQCDTCGKVFTDQVKLRRHEKLHSDIKPYECSVCGKGFHDPKYLKRHGSLHDTSEKLFQCEICNKRYINARRLREHVRLHTLHRPNVCSVCQKSFINKCHLSIHMRIHTGERPHQCEVCGKGFISTGDLTSHRRIHTGEKPFECTTCGKHFSDASNLRKHGRVHTGVKPHLCMICGERYNFNYLLKAHTERYHPEQI